ncbi:MULTISPECIES: hypothetical protein [Clostridium]|uniref:Uncharacterized protein n=3 Tax=Clostridium TaxID=1485 RepID=A0A6M0T2V1_CLOBO|nr:MULTISPECIES: hypothetical protein [Clostridium]APF25185.1 hypothetical protein NPD7_3912 [Clostridium sporogenes]APH16067.1 hypothetical protein NPD5_4008 [Clostridium sporogenes]KOY65520.1 hypothetical protein AN649_13700 [Clostridium sporogenes]MBD5639896.1 hypothetical protein [Clostridium botulinum]NFA61290.1 hypothetical protein [Clostridium botulinum]
MLKKFKNSLKNKKGGLSQLLSVVLLLIITVFIFISAIHPNGRSIDNVGKDSVTAIESEQQQINDLGLPTIPDLPDLP